MTTAHREAAYIAPNIMLAMITSDGGEHRAEVTHQRPGEEPQLVLCAPIPAEALGLVAGLLSRAAERAAG